MYKFLTMLQPAAEQIGRISDVRAETACRFYGDHIVIKGDTPDGRSFELELSIKEKKGDDDGRN